MVESIIVAVIVLGASYYLYRSWRKSQSKTNCGNGGCGCRRKR